MYTSDQWLDTHRASLHLRPNTRLARAHRFTFRAGKLLLTSSKGVHQQVTQFQPALFLLGHAEFRRVRKVSAFYWFGGAAPTFPLPGEECTPGGVCWVALVIHITMQVDIWCHQVHWRPFALTGAALSLQISVTVMLLISVILYVYYWQHSRESTGFKCFLN